MLNGVSVDTIQHDAAQDDPGKIATVWYHTAYIIALMQAYRPMLSHRH
jgi:hypothetical protein